MSPLSIAHHELRAAADARRAAEHRHDRAAQEVIALVRRDGDAIPSRERAVLVVDDGDAERATLVEALSRRLQGVVVHAVESEAAARVALRRIPYAVVVVDYHLGGGRSGLDYARSLGRGPRPVVVTGRANVDTLRHMRVIGRRVEVDIFERPVDAAEWDRFAAYVADQVERATE